MRILLIMLFLPAAMPSFGQSSFSVEMQNYHRKLREFSPSLFLWASKKFEGKNHGIFAYALAGSGYGELQVGRSQVVPLKHPGKVLQFGVSVGLETGVNPVRCGGSVYFSSNPDTSGTRQKGRWQAAIVGETGGSGYWYYGIVTYNTSEKFSIGAQAQALAGVWGPRLQYLWGPALLYISGGYSMETKELGLVNGVRVYF